MWSDFGTYHKMEGIFDVVVAGGHEIEKGEHNDEECTGEWEGVENVQFVIVRRDEGVHLAGRIRRVQQLRLRFGGHRIRAPFRQSYRYWGEYQNLVKR